ncbi:ribonuclease H-like domain-containing protein [Tanacetum coccineum]
MTDYSLWEENRGRENSRRTVTVETPTENALVAQDGIGGYNWSYQAEEVHPTNYALIAIYIFRNSSSSDSRVESNHEYADVKNNGDALEPKTVRKNSFRPLVIEDWNSDDDSEVEFIPNVKDKTVRPSTEKIKFIKSGKINTAGASANTTVRPFNTAGSKTTVNHPRPISNAYKKGYSQVTQPFNKYSTNKNSIFNKKVNNVRVKDNTARDRVVVSKNNKNGLDAVKAISMLIGKGRISEKEKSKQEHGFLILSTDESQVLLRVPRKDNIYSVDLKSVIPTKGLTCLFAKATIDESNLWHRRLGHINFKNINKLVRGNLVRGIFLATMMKLVEIKKTFITKIENQLDYKVKVIRSENGSEFKNSVMNQFCEMKGIKREFSVARTPQQNGVAKRRNRTLIEATRTMLGKSKLPTTFWAKAVNTACYVLKPHTKTPYELIRGRTPLIDFMIPFGCFVTILNTWDHLGKFDGKADEGIFVGYFVVSKAMRVFNKRTRIVKETLNIRFLENAPNVTGNGPGWLFDVDSLTISMNYVANCPKDSKEDVGMKPTEVNESEASDKGEEVEQDTKNYKHRTKKRQTCSAYGPSFTNDDPSDNHLMLLEASNH